MMWEYTGSAWLSYLGQRKGIADKQGQYLAVKKADVVNGLSWLRPAPLDNTFALAIRSEAGRKLGITKLSQISTLPVEDRTFCVEPEFNSRVDGLTPMLSACGLTRGGASSVPASAVRVFDSGAVYTTTDRGPATSGRSTRPTVASTNSNSPCSRTTSTSSPPITSPRCSTPRHSRSIHNSRQSSTGSPHESPRPPCAN